LSIRLLLLQLYLEHQPSKASVFFSQDQQVSAEMYRVYYTYLKSIQSVQASDILKKWIEMNPLNGISRLEQKAKGPEAQGCHLFRILEKCESFDVKATTADELLQTFVESGQLDLVLRLFELTGEQGNIKQTLLKLE